MKELLSLLCLIAIVQSFFLFLVLFIKKKNRSANRLLSTIMLFLSIDLVEYYLTLRGIYITTAPATLSLLPYPYIYGPSLFLYSKVLISGSDKFDKRLLLLYLPFIAALVTNVAFNFITGVHMTAFACVAGGYMPVNEAGMAYKAVLCGVAYYGLVKYSGRLRDFFSNVARMQLVWLRVIILSLLGTETLIFVHYWIRAHERQDICAVETIAISAGTALLFAISFMAALQPEIFDRIKLMNAAAGAMTAIAGPQYGKLRMRPADEEEIVNRLKTYMESEKPFLDEDLTLQDLADELSVGTQQLSMILNIHMKKNFYIFINSYRVREAEKRLSDPAHADENIIDIAYGSGFNSKSTFNAMFKKFTGKTPRQYRSGLS